MLRGSTSRRTWVLIAWLVAPVLPCLAQDAQAPAERPQPHYLFFEAEKAFTEREDWQVQNWFSPSGGEWIYGNGERGTPTGTVTLPGAGPWCVWMRVWDWSQVDRRVVLEVNAEASYVCGGSGTYRWVWYHTHVVDGDRLSLRLIGTDPMDAWVDCIAVSDDPAWVPPNDMANGQAFVSDAPHERHARRPAWIWAHAPPEEVLISAYRRSFRLQGDPSAVHAAARVAGIGFWRLWLNGEAIAEGEQGAQPVAVDLGPKLRQGANALCIELEGGQPWPGVWLEGAIETPDDWVLNLSTNLAWRSSQAPPADWREPEFDDSHWERPWARAMAEKAEQ